MGTFKSTRPLVYTRYCSPEFGINVVNKQKPANMSSGSGIKITDDIKEMYGKIHKQSSKSQKYRYAILKFNATNTGLEIEEAAEANDEVKSYEKVLSELPDNDVRYIFYDFGFVTQSQATSSKVICVSWHPQGSPVKKRMICASTFTALKTACQVGANEALEGDDASDLDVETVLKKVGGVKAA